jgi:hypothetical protein
MLCFTYSTHALFVLRSNRFLLFLNAQNGLSSVSQSEYYGEYWHSPIYIFILTTYIVFLSFPGYALP